MKNVDERIFRKIWDERESFDGWKYMMADYDKVKIILSKYLERLSQK